MNDQRADALRPELIRPAGDLRGHHRCVISAAGAGPRSATGRDRVLPRPVAARANRDRVGPHHAPGDAAEELNGMPHPAHRRALSTTPGAHEQTPGRRAAKRAEHPHLQPYPHRGHAPARRAYRRFRARSPRTVSVTYCDGSCGPGLGCRGTTRGTSTGHIPVQCVLSVRPRVASVQVECT
jgi:hypothetical protein